MGRKRDHNEDQILVTDGLGLFAVADGMGGHDAGDVASSVAAAALEEFFLATEEDPSADELEAPEDLPLGARRLISAVRHANREVFARSGKSANQGGMGATVVALYIDYVEDLLHIVHVGDSRCYRLRDGQLEQLTIDHSMINEALRLNPDLSDEILRQLPSNVITRALGTKEQVEPDVRSEPLCAGDTYLLCSDGLSGEVTDEELRFAMEDQSDLDEACDLLVAMANDAGGRDNISALLVRLEPHDGVSSRPPPQSDVVLDQEEEPTAAIEAAHEVDEVDEAEELDAAALESLAPDEDDSVPVIVSIAPMAAPDVSEEPAIASDPSEPEFSEISDIPEPDISEPEISEPPELEEEEEEEPREDEPEERKVTVPAPPRPERRRAELSALGRRPGPPRPSRPSHRRVSDAELRLDEAVEAALAEVDNEGNGRSTKRAAARLLVVAEPDPIEGVPILGVGDSPESVLLAEPDTYTTCDECGHRVDVKARYCGMCGARCEHPEPDPDVLRCEACNAVLLAGTRFCVKCGTRHPWGDGS